MIRVCPFEFRAETFLMLNRHAKLHPSRSGAARRPHPAALLKSPVLLGALLVSAPQSHADSEWTYRLGESRADQQANFCDSREEALEVAEIFEKFSPLTGYSALANAPGCSTSVRTFTPRRLLKELTLAAGRTRRVQASLCRSGYLGRRQALPGDHPGAGEVTAVDRAIRARPTRLRLTGADTLNR